LTKKEKKQKRLVKTILLGLPAFLISLAYRKNEKTSNLILLMPDWCRYENRHIKLILIKIIMLIIVIMVSIMTLPLLNDLITTLIHKHVSHLDPDWLLDILLLNFNWSFNSSSESDEYMIESSDTSPQSSSRAEPTWNKPAPPRSRAFASDV